MDLSIFFSLKGPWVLRTRSRSEELVPLIERAAGDWKPEFVLLDGALMATRDGFYDELIRKLRLPDYFGRNLNALDECIVELDDLQGDAIIILVECADKTLSSDRSLFEGFVDVLQDAGAEWSRAVEEGGPWDRQARAFHAVLSIQESNLWEDSGIPVLGSPTQRLE